MKRVLIILYYWPPSGGGGVQRWLKFTKYLRDNNWEPIVVAPENADYPLEDEAITHDIPPGIEVIKVPIWEPRRLYTRFFSTKKGKKKTDADNLFYTKKESRSIKQKLSLWVRSNLFIPDARVFWTIPLKKRTTSWLKSNNVDAIITTGTPHSIHLVGKYLHTKTGLPWIADFRDPWTEIEFYEHLTLTSWADALHRKLESEVITQADAVTTVSQTWSRLFESKGAKKVRTITNGFDPTDFGTAPELDTSLTIFHAGTLAFDRNPDQLWKKLAEYKTAGTFSDFTIRLAGSVATQVLDSIREHGLGDHLEYLGYIAHDEAVRYMQQSHVLLLLVNQSGVNAPGRLPGKVFEYMASKRPIVCLGSKESELARILSETGSGYVCDQDKPEDLAQVLDTLIAQFQKHKQLPSNKTEALEQFTRQSLTKRLATLLNELTDDKP